MKTNKIKVDLSLNKQTVSKMNDEDRAAGIPPKFISNIFQATGITCRTSNNLFNLNLSWQGGDDGGFFGEPGPPLDLGDNC